MNNQKVQQEAEKIKYEKMVANQAKNTFKEVISITFQNNGSGYEEMTGWQFSFDIETKQSKVAGKSCSIDTFLNTTSETLGASGFGGIRKNIFLMEKPTIE
ncbi:MAG: hypothetical protein LBI13_10225 [Streptococcaceae bacterium]|nr:hypothetical protein [Streptococcaceae bacterium]